MALERREQPSLDEQREHDLRQIVPNADTNPNFYPEPKSKPDIAPFELPKNADGQEFHNQIPNHPLKSLIPEKERAAAIVDMINGKTINGKKPEPSDLEDFLETNIAA